MKLTSVLPGSLPAICSCLLLLLALGFVPAARAQTNTGTGPNGNVVTTNGTNAALSITSGTNNTAFGYSALQFDTTGSRNLALGAVSLRANVSGNDNVAVGYSALTVSTASGNTALGTQTLNSNTAGTNNVAVGFKGLFANTTGNLNTALGTETLRFNTTGASNLAAGFQALNKNTTGGFNVGLGDGALFNNTTGSGNIGIGEDGGFNLTTGSNNISIGSKGVAGESGIIRIGTTGTHTTTFLAGVITGNGSGLTGITSASLAANSVTATQIANNAVTAAELATNAVTGSKIAAGSVSNTKLASNLTLTGTTSGSFSGNFALPVTASATVGVLSQNGGRLLHTFGFNNFFAGAGAGNFTMTGDGNVAVGAQALEDNTFGTSNTALGTHALQNNQAGNGNIAIGRDAGFSTDGSDNIVIGHQGVAGESGVIRLGTAGTQLKTLLVGNVGVGTDTPLSKMEIVHSSGIGLAVRSTANFSSVDIDAFDGDAAVRFQNNGDNQWTTRNRPGDNSYEIFELGGGGSRLVIQDGTGNVGIGTEPSERLSVTGNLLLTREADRTITMGEEPNNNTAGHALKVKAGSASSTGIPFQAQRGGDLILEAGNGFNQTVPGADGGDLILRSGANWHVNGGTDDGGDIKFQVGGVNGVFFEVAMITELGRFGIGRTPTANNLEVEGDASKTTAGDWAANSDRRIKQDIRTIDHALERLQRVRLVDFRYTEEYRRAHPSIGDERYLNVIAQEFAEVFPDHVKGSGEKLADGSEILQVDTYPLTIYTAAATQELARDLKTSKAEVARLAAENAALKKQVAQQAQQDEAMEARLQRLEALLPSLATAP